MTNQELIDYILSELDRGTSEAEIRNALLGSGWSEADIVENLNAARQSHNVHSVSYRAEPKEKREFLKKRSKVVIALSLAALLLAGSVFAYYKFVVPSPEKMLDIAGINLNKAKAFDFSGTITADVSTDPGILNLEVLAPILKNANADSRVAGASSNVQFGVEFSGTTDLTDDLNPKSDFNLTFNSSIFTFGMKVRIVDKILYLKLDQIPEFTDEVSKYKDVWIKVDPESVSKEYGLGINLQTGQPDLTDGQRAKIEEITKRAYFFTSVKKLNNDSIDGVSMYHYSALIDELGLKSYLDEVNKIVTSAGGFTNQSSEAVEGLQFSDVEVWIGKKDRMIHRISGKISQKPLNNALAYGSANLLLNFRNFDRPTVITAPADSENIIDVIKEIMGENQDDETTSTE